MFSRRLPTRPGPHEHYPSDDVVRSLLKSIINSVASDTTYSSIEDFSVTCADDGLLSHLLLSYQVRSEHASTSILNLLGKSQVHV